MKRLWAFLLVLGIAMGASAAGAADVPFHLDGSGTITTTPGVQSGEVIGTHIGKGTTRGQFFLFGPITQCTEGSTAVNTLGLQTLTAADGSTIDQQLLGVTCQLSSSSYRTTSTYTFLGGKGRFDNVSGTGTHVRVSDFSTSPGTFTLTQDGTLNRNN